MKVRLVSAIVALAIVLPCIIWGGIAGLQVLIFLVALVGGDEFLRMNAPSDRKVWPIFHFLVISLLAIFAFTSPAQHIPALAAALLILCTSVLLLTKENAQGMKIMMSLLAGILYLPVLLVFFIKLRELPNGLSWLILPLVITWLADTGAYFAGRQFGSKKLFPRVSPKKTWEGVYGGVALGIIGGTVYVHFALTDVSVIHGMIIGALLSALSVVGDLVESLMKRARDIKDSGWIMPGHGGILDRLDSLFFAVPAAWLYAEYVLKLF